jgi:hypothetical protein
MYDKCYKNKSMNTKITEKLWILYLDDLEDIYNLWTLSCCLNKRLKCHFFLLALIKDEYPLHVILMKDKYSLYIILMMMEIW